MQKNHQYKFKEEILDIEEKHLFDASTLKNLSLDNIVDVLNKCKFWDIEYLPYEILSFCFKHIHTKSFRSIYVKNFCKDIFQGVVVIYFNEINIIFNTMIFSLGAKAISIGNKNLLMIAHENGCPWDEYTFHPVGWKGHFPSKDDCPRDKLTCARAAQKGYLDCLKYAHEHGCPWEGYLYMFVAENGYLECLKYLHENGCPWDEDTDLHLSTCQQAAKNGYLDCLKYAHEHGCPWDENTCIRAAEFNHLDCLKYAHEHGCPWDAKYTCSCAAIFGHLACLKYVHEHGCHWDEETCKEAAKNGHLECLVYAHEHGCPWDKSECLKLAKENCKQYILDN